MGTCKNKGCPGHARRGQYFCHDMQHCCKHPSAKVKDEAAPMRLKVVELEGRLALSEMRNKQRVPMGAHNFATLVAVIVGAALACWIK